MTALRGWGLSEQHLAIDAIVALVDGELSPNAYDRAIAHLARCTACAAEAAEQRQARAAVQDAPAPSVSPSLLQALQAIPGTAELPSAPEGLALSQDGQLVTVTRHKRVEGLGGDAPLGSSSPLGGGRPLGAVGPFESADEVHRRVGRRTKQGASVVFSGLVLGALAFMNLPTDDNGRPMAPMPMPSDDLSNAVLPAAGQRTMPPQPAASASAIPVSVPTPVSAPASAPTPASTPPPVSASQPPPLIAPRN